ncbi:MAG: tetratricopeptide repeat protein [bacterium]
MKHKSIIFALLTLCFSIFHPLASLLSAYSSSNIKWWNSDFKCRKTVYPLLWEKTQQPSGIVYTTFTTGGLIKDNGSDIRVIDNLGNIVSHKLIHCDPLGKTKIIFDAKISFENYYIYFNNPNAQPANYNWNPLYTGLLLETRKLGSGYCKNWHQMKRLLDRNEQIYGKGYVPNIFQGYNLFGTSERFISIYSGHIYCAQTGLYWFATASDDASFLFIDNRLVTQWPGGHGASEGVYGKYGGKIHLKAGIHKIDYYHTQFSGVTTAVAGWKKPEDKYFKLIPAQAFLSPIHTKVTNFEKYDNPIAADFTWEQISNYKIDKNIYSCLQFYNLSGDQKLGGLCIWDFGDGTTSKKTNPLHVYLQPGEYKVKLKIIADKVILKDAREIRGQIKSISHALEIEIPNGTCLFPAKEVQSIEKDISDTTSQNIRTMDVFFNKDEDYKNRSRKYTKIISEYLNKCDSPKTLMASINFFLQVREDPLTAKACNLFLEQFSSLDPIQIAKVFIILGDFYKNSKKNPEQAFETYKKVLHISNEKNIVLLARWKMADIVAFDFKNYDKAIIEYKNILKEYENKKNEEIKQILINLGDSYKALGDINNAAKYYISASGKKDIYMQGYYMHTISNYIKRKKINDAMEKIKKWEDQYPLSKLGYSSLYKAECYYYTQCYSEAIKELNMLIKINPESTILPEAKLFLAHCYRAKGNFSKADKLYKQITTDYPGTKFAIEAKSKM